MAGGRVWRTTDLSPKRQRPRAHGRRTRQAPELAGVARGLGTWSAWSGAWAATHGRGLCAHPRRWTVRRGRPRGSDVRAPARVPQCARPERPSPAGARSHCRSWEPHFTYRHTRPQSAGGIPTCPRRAVTRRRFQRAVGATPYGESCDRGGGLGAFPSGQAALPHRGPCGLGWRWGVFEVVEEVPTPAGRSTLEPACGEASPREG